MNPQSFLNELKSIQLSGVFNPYADKCGVHDLVDAPEIRRRNLRSYLSAIVESGADTVWMGRDLGYRGGRRTGLALTDEAHLNQVGSSYPGSTAARATKGPLIAERTAAEIWALLPKLQLPPLLWNVFPFHPHDEDEPFSNRRFTSRELAAVNEANHVLFSWLNIRRIVCIGQDAMQYAQSFGVEVECVRHPSYGGVRDFRAGIKRIYGELMSASSPKDAQTCLF
ncbi:MAG: uracil-DNA glycosylase [Rubrivivax sp.]|nr:MAG: uracil-DNA glycosylase [Rubrivivax sp.]